MVTNYLLVILKASKYVDVLLLVYIRAYVTYHT